MTGRRVCTDDEAVDRGFWGLECALRRRVLRDTLARLESRDSRDRYSRLADKNLQSWQTAVAGMRDGFQLEILPLDWGVAASRLTSTYGECFAVLNMANSLVPGGAYVEGASAQEENMYRRTDCLFSIDTETYDRDSDRYRPFMTKLIEGADGRVYLDTDSPRVCVRGPEDRSEEDLGYAWLDDNLVFPFFELRAAACNLRDGSPFDPAEMRRRVAAQLDTLIGSGVRHVLLGAFGCGAFRNPAAEVSKIYREELQERYEEFAVVGFAIHRPGYGPDNFSIFAREFEEWSKPGNVKIGS